MKKGKTPDKGKKRRTRYAMRRFRTILFQRALVLLLIFLQFALWIAILQTGAATFRWMQYVFTGGGVLLSFYVVSKNMPAAYKLLWVFFLLLAPIPGTVFYLLLKVQGSTARYRREEQAIAATTQKSPYLSGRVADLSAVPEPYRRILRFFDNAGCPAYTDTETTYFPLGEDKFRSLLAELEKAESYIFLEYFIIDDGEMWEQILSVLRKKAAFGVDVRLMMDDVGCFLLRPRRYAKRLREFGFKVEIFNGFTPFITAAQNYRDHRKIVVIDGKVAYTGGVNLGDEYINRRRRFGHWKDTAVMVRGAAAWGYTVAFLRMWAMATHKKEDFRSFLPDFPAVPDHSGNGIIVPYADSPMEEPIVKPAYLAMIHAATRYLYITTPYLILDDSIGDALTLAARSGVDVRIVTPHTADKKLVNVTTKSYYRPLLDAGVRIYEYTPGFIHAKMMLSDDTVASVGSANLDYRSLYLSFECGAFLYGGNVIADVRRDFDETLAVSREIRKEDLPRENVLRRMLAQVLALFAPLM